MNKIVFVGVLAATATLSHAVITFFNNQASWQAAAGSLTFSEDFSGFGSDTLFRSSAVAINGGMLGQEGFDQAFRNLVDVNPQGFSDNNGTNNASMYTNASDNGNPPATNVRLTFTSLNHAFGFSTWGAASGEVAAIDVYNGASLLGSISLTDGSGAFTGFVLDGGDVATSVVWRSVNTVAGTTGEGFGMDDLVGVSGDPVPEPFTMALGIGALALALKRKRNLSK
jgi:hypothetical protein